ncbi:MULTISPECIES: DUF4235 domain-containing protein [unclassified Kitasatospora]|uniref:DUF4235 domain-containing protein n=1 Tax=unclassified Kitasatospora TaxID=2633591 RepID=UPI002E35BFF1|nr:DUF4235 domain-containing protein [Kitasatospora sp. NBC_01246]
MIKILYKPLGLLFGVLGGLIAGALFRRLWALLGHEEDAPEATDQERTWREVLTAAALQGALFALVKAAVDRGGAVGTRRLTGTWPD